MRPGQEVSIEIEGIGTLTNGVTADTVTGADESPEQQQQKAGQ